MNTHTKLLAVIFIVTMLFAGIPEPAAAQNGPASQILQLVNQLRAGLGLTPFALDARLTVAAQSHAQWMAANVSYTHTGEGGSRPLDRATAAGYQGWVSENIVGGTNMSPQQGVIWWENSAIHYQTMTSTRHIHAGVGYAAAANGQNMYVLVVGVPSDYAPSSSQSTSAAEANQAAPQAAAPIIAVPLVRAEPAEDGTVIHEVQIGQTAWDISAVYEVTIEELLMLNNLRDDPILLPGDQIVVVAGENMVIDEGPLTHTVREGQTAWSIAVRYNISLDDLIYLNNLGPNAVILPDDVLIIRLAEGQAPPPTPTPPVTHIVQAGETAWVISARYGLTLEEFYALNDLPPEPILLPGDEYIIREVDPATPTPLPTATPTSTPSVEPTTEAPPTAEVPPTVEVAILPSLTAEVIPIMPDASPTPAPSETPMPSETPTLTPPPSATPMIAVPSTPDPADQDAPRFQLNWRVALGGVIILAGVIALVGFVAIEFFERLRR